MMQKKNENKILSKNSYWQNIYQGIKTSWEGLSISIKHLFNAFKRHKPTFVTAKDYFDLKNGLVTVQYPHEQIPLPDNARYQLHNEMDDCIVCDKCAKICPVNCIDIETIKATEQVGTASDGSPIRLYASKFDIDLAKCCYCGLCTTVCPTDCLTMTHTFDVSTYSTSELLAHFATLSPQEAQEKLDLLAIFQLEKKQASTEKGEGRKEEGERNKDEVIGKNEKGEDSKEKIQNQKPKFIPKMKSPLTPKEDTNEQIKEESKKEESKEEIKTEIPETKNETPENPAKPKFIPKIKPKIAPNTQKEETNDQIKEESKKEESKEEIKTEITETKNETPETPAKPKFIPKMKPKINTKPKDEE